MLLLLQRSDFFARHQAKAGSPGRGSIARNGARTSRICRQHAPPVGARLQKYPGTPLTLTAICEQTLAK
jgi:hypothetical protein